MQKSKTFQNDFQILGHIKLFVGSSLSFSNPNFLSGPSKKGSTFMIAFDHNLILRYFRFLPKTKNSPFSMPIYHQTHLDTEKKIIFHDDQHGKTKKKVHLRFLIFEILSRTFFNDRKSIFQKIKMCEIMKIQKSLKLFCKNA